MIVVCDHGMGIFSVCVGIGKFNGFSVWLVPLLSVCMRATAFAYSVVQ